MKKSVFMAAVLAAGWAGAAWPAAARSAVTKEQIDKAIDQLVENGELWAKNEKIPPGSKANLKGLKIDKASASVVAAALRRIRRDLPGSYATARLMEHIQTADTEAQKALLSEVNTILQRASTSYRPFPAVSGALADALSLPTYNSSLTTEAIMSRMGKLESLRQAKIARDMPVAKQNEAAWDTETAGYKIVALVGGVSEDNRAVSNMMRGELAGDGVFQIIASAYLAAAPKMDPTRAGKLYGMLRPHALRLRMQRKKNYTLKGQSKLEATGPSTMATTPDYAGVRLVQLLNKLADSAKNKRYQKMPVLTGRQIDEAHKPPKKKGKK